MTDPKQKKLLRAARLALATARRAIAEVTPEAASQVRAVLALRAAADAVAASGLDARLAGELALSAEHRSATLRRKLAGAPEAPKVEKVLGDLDTSTKRAEDHKIIPFFARFLEEQATACAAATAKFPSDADDYVTLKYPSDRDEVAESAELPNMVTLKYPSDGDENVVVGGVPGRIDEDDDPTEVMDRGAAQELRAPPARKTPFDEEDDPIGTAELDEALKKLARKGI